jgi:hypothetical protein
MHSNHAALESEARLSLLVLVAIGLACEQEKDFAFIL